MNTDALWYFLLFGLVVGIIALGTVIAPNIWTLVAWAAACGFFGGVACTLYARRPRA